MVVPAMQLASKIPDMSVQLWSSALLKGASFSQSCSDTMSDLLAFKQNRWCYDASGSWKLLTVCVCVACVDLNEALGNTMEAHEAAQMHQNFSQQLLQDHIAACSLPEHNLISVCSTKWQPLCPPCPIAHCSLTFNSRLPSSFHCSSLFSSGPMDRRRSRSKPRTARPPASQACYENTTAADTSSEVADWCITSCFETTVAEIREDCTASPRCSPLPPPTTRLSATAFELLPNCSQ